MRICSSFSFSLFPSFASSRLRLPCTALFSLLLTFVLCFQPHAQEISFSADMALFKPEYGRNGMVVAAEKNAVQAGVDVLKQGGNAVDAATAVGFALAVTLPNAGNLGGGGFMMFYNKPTRHVYAIDYRETAPAKAHKDMFLTKGQVDTHKAQVSLLSSGVPGTVAGLLATHAEYGKLSRSQVMAPAIRLAEEGFEVTQALSLSIWDHRKRLSATPEARRIFFKEDGSMYLPGDIWRQPDLARTLRLISEQGPSVFYEGEIADKIVADMQRYGGWMTKEDLLHYDVVVRDPIIGTYRGYKIAAMPPPSSGGVHIIQMLNTLSNFDLKKMGHNSADMLHVMAETMRRAYLDRSYFLGDPDFVKMPLEELTSGIYGRRLAEAISMKSATPSAVLAPGQLFTAPKESPQTTHYSVVDKEGSIVSNTYTLNFSYGNGHVVTGTGFLLNNEMDDFSSKAGVANAYGLIGGDANRIEAGKRPLSSMTPVIVFKNNDAVFATGSPGGSRIITTVLQVLVNLIDFEMNVAEAVSMPRIHHQWMPDELRYERGISPDTVKILASLGHKMALLPPMGAAMTLAISPIGTYGAADPRRGGAVAIGY